MSAAEQKPDHAGEQYISLAAIVAQRHTSSSFKGKKSQMGATRRE